nr:ATP-binding protein [Roseovarius litorisediminis]
MAIVMARLHDARILYRSPAAVKFFGETENAFEHYADPKDREKYVDKLMRAGRVDDYHVTLRDARGQLCATTSWGRLVEFEGDTYVVTAIMDLTDQQEREAMIRQILEACPTPIQMSKAYTGEVLFSSRETISLFGRVNSAKQFYVKPDQREEYLKQLRRDGSVTEYKGQYLNADKKPFWGAVSARLIRYNGEEVIVSNTRDMTEQLRIEAELAQQRDHLYQNEKLSAMGELLAGVAHELNNPLSVVVGHSLMLREDCKEPELLRQVEKISNAAERCARIVKTFLTMARQNTARMQSVDINEIAHTAVDVVRYGDAASDVNITCNLGTDLTKICADSDQITQVFINLILNAEQAMRDAGVGQKITVSTQQAKNDTGVEIMVEDDGPGIPENIRSRVFEPFFTTKEVGDGTGIGLALCHRIIQSHEGHITVAAGANGGSVFRIFLPRDTEVRGNAQASQTSDLATNRLRILILDDEEDVAELNAEILTRGGYQVDTFNHAELALESMRHHDYGLILSDLNMPETDGRGFFETIKQEFPEMISKTGFVTGDTMGRSSQSFLGEANRPCIEKPVSPKELRAFVTEILAKTKQVTE